MKADSDNAIEENETVKALFESVIDEGTEIEFSALNDDSVPALLGVSEEIRRMEEMMRMYGISNPTPPAKTLIINSSSPLIKKLADKYESNDENAKDIAEYVYKLALLSQKKFTAEEMQDFMENSYKLLMKL